jgi:hypothetical protein
MVQLSCGCLDYQAQELDADGYAVMLVLAPSPQRTPPIGARAIRAGVACRPSPVMSFFSAASS